MATVPATTNAVIGETTSRTETTNDTGTATTQTATPPAVTASDPAPSEAPKPEPVKAPDAQTVASNGATELKDGNKSEPGTTAAEHSTTGDNAPVAVSPSGDAGTDAARQRDRGGIGLATPHALGPSRLMREGPSVVSTVRPWRGLPV